MLCAGAVCLALAGCGSTDFGGASRDGDPTSAPTGAEEAPATPQPEDDGVDLGSDEGSFSTGGRLPDLWPADFPIPEGAEVAQSAGFTDESGSRVAATLTTQTGGPETFAFYQAALAEAIESESAGDTGGRFFGNLALTGRWNGNVAVFTDPTEAHTTVEIVLAV